MDKMDQKNISGVKNPTKCRFSGFTLIELLVVVLIIGILAAVALPQYEKAVARSRLSNAITLASSIAQAEQVYYMANGKYTLDLDELDISLPECSYQNEAGKYDCGNLTVRLYEAGAQGQARISVQVKQYPCSILWGFEPDMYRWCLVNKSDKQAELGKSICATYGKLLLADNPSYWYYDLY